MTLLTTIRRASAEMWLDAVYEVVVITICCLAPLIAGAYWAYLNQPASTANPESFGHYLSDNIVRGQLAFYAISNWAAVAWLCGREFHNVLTLKAALIMFCLVGFFYCGLLVAVGHLPRSTDPSIGLTSSLLYVISIACYLFITLFEKIPPPSMEDSNAAGAASLKHKLLKRRGHG